MVRKEWRVGYLHVLCDVSKNSYSKYSTDLSKKININVFVSCSVALLSSS